MLLAGPLRAQDDPAAGLEHRFADIGGLQIEYFQFGDTGTPIILLQDHHDYFHDVYGPGEFDELREWIGFLNELGRNHRVVTPVRRGWGESEDPGYGYDVATQAEDVLGVMDRLGIAKAVLLGRMLATQEMTWIAEHHPERVMGLVYWGTPIGHLPRADPTREVTRFGEMYNRVACDIGGGDGEAIDARLDPRRGWWPHFSRDESRRIEIPALLVLHPVWDRVSMESRRLDRIEAWAPDDFGDPDGWCDEEARAYFTELSRDPERIASLRQAFEELDELSRTQEAMRHAFGSHLVVVWEEEQPDNPVVGPLISAVEEFVRGLEGAGRSDATPPSDSLVAAAVMERTRDLADAWERLDSDAYLAHFSDDLTFYFEGARVSRARFEAVVRESIGSLRESTFEILNVDRIELSLLPHGREWQLMVRDDGRGFDGQVVGANGRRGHGLRSVQWRAEEIGGDLDLSAAPRRLAGLSEMRQSPVADFARGLRKRARSTHRMIMRWWRIAGPPMVFRGCQTEAA